MDEEERIWRETNPLSVEFGELMQLEEEKFGLILKQMLRFQRWKVLTSKKLRRAFFEALSVRIKFWGYRVRTNLMIDFVRFKYWVCRAEKLSREEVLKIMEREARGRGWLKKG